MHRNKHSTSVAIIPTLPESSGGSFGFFTKGNPGLSVAATVPTADWANGITEEIAGAIVESGQNLSQTNLTQLSQAIGTIGKRRNLILNGSFDFWDYSTSSAVQGYTTANRWGGIIVGSTISKSQQAFTLGQVAVPGNPKFFHRTIVTSVAAAGNFAYQSQRIEDVSRFSGQTVTVSFWAKADASKNIGINLAQLYGSGGSPSASTSNNGVLKALTTSWQLISQTFTVADLTGKVIGSNNDSSLEFRIWFDCGSTFNAQSGTLGQQSGTFDIAQVQVEFGSIATPKEQVRISYEYQSCQRYLQLLNLTPIAGTATAAQQVQIANSCLPVRMFSTPTATLTAGTLVNGSSPTVNISNDAYRILMTSTAAGVVGMSTNSTLKLESEI